LGGAEHGVSLLLDNREKSSTINKNKKKYVYVTGERVFNPGAG